MGNILDVNCMQYGSLPDCYISHSHIQLMIFSNTVKILFILIFEKITFLKLKYWNKLKHIHLQIYSQEQITKICKDKISCLHATSFTPIKRVLLMILNIL